MYRTLCAGRCSKFCFILFIGDWEAQMVWWPGLNGGDPANYLCSRLLHCCISCCHCRNVVLALPDLPWSQKRQEIHIFMDIFWSLKQYRPSKHLWLLHYILNPILFSQHPYKIGIIICSCPLSTQLISSKIRFLCHVCLCPQATKVLCSLLLPLDWWQWCWRIVLAEKCCMVQAKPLTKLSHCVVLHCRVSSSREQLLMVWG